MAEKDKRFYWLKLKTEFMNGEIVDFLMSQKNGANYVVLYEMLAIKTINTDGKLCSKVGEVIIPFDPEKIQRECKWFDIDTIMVAMELYCKLGLLYKNEENILQLTNFDELVGNESYWAKQKRIERNNGVGQSLDNVQQPLISNILNSNDNSCIKEEIKNKEEKHRYGEYKHIYLTDRELEKLKADYGEEETKEAIKYLDEYIEMRGTVYKSHYLVIKKWVFTAVKEQAIRDERANAKTPKKLVKERKYTTEELNSFYTNIDEIKL